MKAWLFVVGVYIWVSLSFAQFAGGLGTEADPYQVATAEHLNNVRDHLSVYFIQTADIDLGVKPWNQGEGWVPIGDNDSEFTGNYDGDGHKIYGLIINRPSTNYQGLFGRTMGSIHNLGVINVSICGNDNIGGLVGFSYQGIISNCYSMGCVSGDSDTGGLVGHRYGKISNCFSKGTVSGVYRTGGLVGSSDHGIIINCYSTGSVSGDSDTGGLVGYNDYFGTISNCYSTVKVSGNYETGGLAGCNLESTIYNCYSTGCVSGNDNTGGLVGFNYVSKISNCYSKGSVTGYSNTGGLVGYNDYSVTISNCYSTGSVTGDSNTGGLVGQTLSGTISNCYWDTQTSGQNYSAGGESRTTVEMTWPHTANTYVNWDWWIWKPDIVHCVNSGYPYFKLDGEDNMQIPEAAILVFPSDQATSVPVYINLRWQANLNSTYTNPPSGFRLWLGTDFPPTNLINGSDLSYSNSFDNFDFSTDTTYYWRIVPYNQIGEAHNCPIWSFETCTLY